MTVCILLAGYTIAPFLSAPASGVFPSFLQKLIIFGHHSFVCPFCGATRAFMLCCRFEFIPALHCSFLGFCFFFWLWGTLPFRMVFCAKSIPCRKTMLNRIEYSYIPLIFTTFLFVLQLLLHYQRIWFWIPLIQLNNQIF